MELYFCVATDKSYSISTSGSFIPDSETLHLHPEYYIGGICKSRLVVTLITYATARFVISDEAEAPVSTGTPRFHMKITF